MMLAIVIRCGSCRSVEALVPAGPHVVACRIDAAGLWWCECQPGRTLRNPTPADCCPHLYALGSSPRSTQTPYEGGSS